jgi:CubicO group peptidase (beta-lactamase class C family)
MKKTLLHVLYVLAVAQNNFAQQPAFITDSLDAYVQREIKRWQIPGAAIAIVKDNDVVVAKGYGVTDLETNQPVDGNTLFMIASNTKIFTGTSLALLHHQKRLSLDDKVVSYLPYFKMYNDTLTQMVTIEDLLSHRMGFETFQGDFYNWYNNATRQEIIKNIAKNKPAYQFRDTWGYCNAGFVAAGEILQTVTDTSWEDFIQHRFFTPLGMYRSSTTNAKISADKNACKPYTIFQNKLVKLNYDNIDNIGPCASINSCANDLTNWMHLQLNKGKFNGVQIFPAEVIDETRQPRSIEGRSASPLFPSKHYDLYGLGIGMNDYNGKEMLWHTGGADGFVTTVCFVPEINLGVAVLTNTDANYFFLAALYQIIEAYLNMPYRNMSAIFYTFYERNTNNTNEQLQKWFEQAATYKPLTKQTAEQFTGKYYNGVYGDMHIQFENGKLNMYFEHHPQLTGQLQMLTDSSFLCRYDPVNWGVKELPFTLKNGEMNSISVTVNDFIDFGVYEFIKR